jgi:hypothetical protein
MTAKKRARNRSKRAGAAAAATNSNRPQRQRQPLGQLDLPAKEPTAAAIRRSIYTSDVDNYSKHDGIIYAGNTTHGVLHVIDSTGEGQPMHIWLGDIKLWTMAVEHIRLKYGCNTIEFTPFSSSQNWAKMHPELKIVGSIQPKSNSPKKQQKHDSPPKDGVIKEEDICVHGLVIPYDNERLKETLSRCDEAAAAGNVGKVFKLALGYIPESVRGGRKPFATVMARRIRSLLEAWDAEDDNMPTDVPDDMGILIKVLVKHPELFQVSEESFDNVHVQWIKSHFVFEGTKCLLRGDIDAARCNAVLSYLFEQIFVMCNFEGTDIDFSSVKGSDFMRCIELSKADAHTLCSFFRKRIPCSCLKKMYKEVKSVTKLKLSKCCFNVGCNRQLMEKTMMCCSLCRQVSYCSRKCQKADWTAHKINCGIMSALSQNPKEWLVESLKSAEAVLDPNHRLNGAHQIFLED